MDGGMVCMLAIVLYRVPDSDVHVRHESIVKSMTCIHVKQLESLPSSIYSPSQT
jgi:hypothetical protein